MLELGKGGFSIDYSSTVSRIGIKFQTQRKQNLSTLGTSPVHIRESRLKSVNQLFFNLRYRRNGTGLVGLRPKLNNGGILFQSVAYAGNGLFDFLSVALFAHALLKFNISSDITE